MPSAATLPDPAPIEEVLRVHLAEHNRRAVGVVILNLFTAVAGWVFLRFVIQWLSVFFVTVIKGMDAQMPGPIDPVFWPAAVVWVGIAWVDARFHPDARPRDHKSAGEILWECFLVLPRLTLAIWSNFAARQKLSPHELSAAAALVERLQQVQKLRLSSMPLELPHEGTRYRVLFALQLVKVIDVRRQDRELWVALNPLRPPALLPPVSRPDPPRASGL